MFRYLKYLHWDLADQYSRLDYINSILMHIPGTFGMNIRAKVLPKYFAECGQGIHISVGVRFRGIHRLRVGNNVRIGIDNFLNAGGGISLGNDVMLGPGTKIWSMNHQYDDPSIPIPDQGYHYDPVSIGNGVWLAANVFVLPGVTIPEGCVISACSVVSKKLYKPYSILAGNPCRMIGVRKNNTCEPGALPVSQRLAEFDGAHSF